MSSSSNFQMTSSQIYPPKNKTMLQVIALVKLSQQLYILSSFTALYVVIWCSTTAEVSHIFITAENALISLNFVVVVVVVVFVLLLIAYCCCCVLYNNKKDNHKNNQSKTNDNENIHIN